MSLKEEDRRIIVELEMEKAERILAQWEALSRAQLWDTLANRLYYALFHAVSAMLVYDCHEVGTHRGAANRFHMYYVRTGRFTKEEGSFYSQMQTMREEGDYNCSYNVTESDILPRVELVCRFVEKVKRYIKTSGNNPS